MLRPSSTNPRYFQNDLQDAIYLVGSHTWNNLVDMDDTYPPGRLDFSQYLDFLKIHNHNFIRLWAWELPRAASERYERRTWAAPMPWARVSVDRETSLPQFDLRQPNYAYYARLRHRVAEAERRGFYVSIMLFEGWGVQFAPGKDSHPFHRDNNVNGVHHGGDPASIHTLSNPEITSIQEAHVRAVIDAVNEFDNVLYEIVNESGPYSTAWQTHFVEYIRDYEAGLEKQHPVGMTFQYPGGSNATLFESDADWISPGPESGEYEKDPSPATGRKIIISDTDHLGGSSFGTRGWVWKSFTRGLNPIFMDRYEGPQSVTDREYENAREVRLAMGLTRLMANRIDLAAMTPRPRLASSGYVLASPAEYLVYDSDGGGVRVGLKDASGSFEAEWFDPASGTTFAPYAVQAGDWVHFSTPLESDGVLYLYRAGSQPSDSMSRLRFEGRARALVRNSAAALRSSSPGLVNRVKRELPGSPIHWMILAATGAAAGFLLLLLWRAR